MLELFKNPNYDFIGKRKWAYYVSIAFTLLSLVSLAARGGLRYDLDFTGGTPLQARFDGTPAVAPILPRPRAIPLRGAGRPQIRGAPHIVLPLPPRALTSQEAARPQRGAP